MPPKKAAASVGAKKPRATAAYTKTGGKDGKGRVVYVSAKGVERVRCRSAATGKAEWRKPAAVSAKSGGWESVSAAQDHLAGMMKIVVSPEKVTSLSQRLNEVKARIETIAESSEGIPASMDGKEEIHEKVKQSIQVLNADIAELNRHRKMDHPECPEI